MIEISYILATVETEAGLAKGPATAIVLDAVEKRELMSLTRRARGAAGTRRSRFAGSRMDGLCASDVTTDPRNRTIRRRSKPGPAIAARRLA